MDIVEGLSNWYVRRSRERFSGPGLPVDKRDAYSTLYEAAQYTDRIALTLDLGEVPRLRSILEAERNKAQIAENCLVARLEYATISADVERTQIGDEWVRLTWRVAS